VSDCATLPHWGFEKAFLGCGCGCSEARRLIERFALGREILSGHVVETLTIAIIRVAVAAAAVAAVGLL
jgi:hypothetical protein